MGYQAAGMAKLSLAVKQLEQLVPLLGATSEAGADVLEAIKKLAKHIPPGAVNQAAEKNSMQQMMMKQQQMSPMIAAQRMAQGGGAAPGATAAPAGV